MGTADDMFWTIIKDNNSKNIKKSDLKTKDVEELFAMNPNFEVDCIKAIYGFSILVLNVSYQDLIYAKKYWQEIPNKLPENLEKYSHKIILRNNLNFIDYHKEFLDVYCILPLITKKTHPQYYNNKLTSSINYCIGYNLKCIIDKDLQEIYNLNNVEVFNDENDIVHSFRKTLIDFYKY